jgi:hypothetical protein
VIFDIQVHTFGLCKLSANVDANTSEQDGLRYGQVLFILYARPRAFLKEFEVKSLEEGDE